MKKIIYFIKNKYIIAITVFIVWIAFFDRNDVVSQLNTRNKLLKLQKEKKYYQNEINKNKEDLRNLITNKKSLEKLGREKYLMKKDNEEVFVIINKSSEE